jgi:hypothetical protein
MHEKAPTGCRTFFLGVAPIQLLPPIINQAAPGCSRSLFLPDVLVHLKSGIGKNELRQRQHP